MPVLLRSLGWSALDTLGTLALGLGSIVLLARLIGPAEFGLGALAIGLMLLVLLPTGSLVHDAIVQKADISPRELDAAISVSIVVAALACIAVAALAWPLAQLMGEPRLTFVIWALLPTVIAGAATAPLIAERRRAMEFGLVSRWQLASRAAGLALALGVALAGRGVWAIVAQQLATTGLLALGLVLSSSRPIRWRLDWRAAKPLLGFSHYIVWTQLLLQATDRLFLLAIGYVGGVTAAGYWGAAARIVESFTGIVNVTSYHVALAHLARLQHDRAALARAMVDGRALLMLGLVPILTGIASVTDPLIGLVLGEAWLPAGTLVLLMLLGALVGTHVLVPAVALNALGKTGTNFAAAVATGLASLLGVVLAGPFGMTMIAAVRGGAPLAGWLVVERQLARHLPKAARRGTSDLLLALLVVVASLLLARNLVPMLVAKELAYPVVEAGLASTLAFASMAVAHRRTVGGLIRQARRSSAAGT
jgi:PST family polysaccharide transporter